MTKPLTQEIAEKYGYNEEYFRGWTKKYVDSLNLDNLKFKPIENINLYNHIFQQFLELKVWSFKSLFAEG